jgi:hypothetical protein
VFLYCGEPVDPSLSPPMRCYRPRHARLAHRRPGAPPRSFLASETVNLASEKENVEARAGRTDAHSLLYSRRGCSTLALVWTRGVGGHPSNIKSMVSVAISAHAAQKWRSDPSLTPTLRCHCRRYAWLASRRGDAQPLVAPGRREPPDLLPQRRHASKETWDNFGAWCRSQTFSGSSENCATFPASETRGNVSASADGGVFG